MSHRKWPWIACGIACALFLGMVCLLSAQAIDSVQTQTTPKKKTPLDLVLRSIAVLEWTGPAEKPTSSLLIPVTVYTDDRYMDGGDYLAEPVPLAVENGTQYVLEKSGVPQGDYDLNAAGKLRGNWFGSGTWEPLHAKNPYALVAASDSDRPHFGADSPSDEPPLPKLHRRPSPNAPKTPPPDPNRPIMAYGKPPQKSLADFTQTTPIARHQMIAISDAVTRDVHPLAYAWSDPTKKEAMEQKVQAIAEKILQQALQPKLATDAGIIAQAAASDSDRPHFGASISSGTPDTPPLPVLHRRPSPDAPKTPPPDPNRPIMAYGKPPQKSLADFTQTTLIARHQMIAISDAVTRDVHPLAYAWSDPTKKEAMEQKVQAIAEKILQQALQPKLATDAGIIAQAAASDQPKDTTPHLVRRPKPKPAAQVAKQPTAPANSTPQLVPVDFRCFALAYEKNPSQATPTCVWSGETAPQVTPKHYVTVITQQDIYGAPQLISQAETDATQLATHPSVRLVDAVDAAANHQAELMFEIDEAGSRQFGLYKVNGSKVKLAYVTKKLAF